MSDILAVSRPAETRPVAAATTILSRKSGCRDTVSIFERIVLWVLITMGIESAIFFLEWWVRPQHRRNLAFFAFLTFAIGWGVVRSVINWFYFLFLKIPRPIDAPDGMSADVFTTAMPGEPYEMFEKTLTAIAGIRYPHESYLLDGGNDPKLKALAQRLGIHHVNCSAVKGAKAGKINFALSKSMGEFVLVVDPDHIPEPDFLDRVLGYFSDSKVGFVQVVQGYYNQSMSAVARGSAEQTYGFYGPSMIGMNGLGTSVVIGANCTFRRNALDGIGGHAIHLAEDLVTSIRLHAAGWKSVYVPHRLSLGLVPEDIGSYFKQQLKWCCGMFEAFAGEYLPRFFKLNLAQKLHYLFAGTYYLEGVANAITCMLPVIFLFFNLWAVEMAFSDFLLHIVPYVLVSFLIGSYVQKWYRHPGEKGIPWRGALLQKGTWPIYVLGLIYFLSRTNVPYLPTPKKPEEGVFTGLVLPHIAVIVLSIAAIVYSLLTCDRFVTGVWLMIFFAACNIVLMVPSVIIAHANLWRRRGETV